MELSNRGRHRAGRRVLTRALARADAATDRARVEISLAYAEAETGDVAQGLRRCRGLVDRREIPDAVRGLAWSQLGLLLVRTGEAVDALGAFDRAAGLLSPQDHAARARLHLNRGNVHLQRGVPVRAEEDFEAAARHFALAGNGMEEQKALHNLGCTQVLTGQVATALTTMAGPAEALAPLSPAMNAVILQDRAEALIAAGQVTAAAEALDEAVRLFARARLRQGQAEALYLLAGLQLRQDPVAAWRTARRSRRLLEARGSTTWAARAEGAELSAEVLGGAPRAWPPEELRGRLDSVASRLHERGFVHEALVLRLHAVRVIGRQVGPETALPEQRRIRLRADSPISSRLLAAEVRAELLDRADRPVEARRALRHGLAELHAWQAGFGSLDLQTSLAGHGRGLALAGLAMAVRDGRPSVVHEWSERARALAAAVTPLRPPRDPEFADELQRLRVARAGVARADGAGGAAPALVRQVSDSERRIRERAWHWDGSGRVVQPVGLGRVQEELAQADGMLLSHVVVGGRLHLLAVQRSDAQVLDLGPVAPALQILAGLRADLDVVAGEVPDALRQVVRQGTDARLGRLQDLLLGPVLRRLPPGRPVVLSPSGALAGLPWAMLPALRGRPLTQARSASSWVRERGRAPASRTALLVAGPGVPRGDEEIAAAAAQWRGTAHVLTGRAATVPAVAAAAERADVLHVAAHGRHSADNPLFSGLELADGPWFGYDVDRLRTVPRTVVLSACELGRATVRWGEETLGMTQAWLHAGAGAVVAAPAAVGDEVACEVLAATHQRLAQGAPPAEALADAQVRTGLSDPFLCFGAGW